jgi:hypothetical protein
MRWSQEETEYDEDDPYLLARPRPCRECGVLLTAATWPLHRLRKRDHICGPCHRRMSAAYAAKPAAPRALRPIKLYTHMPFGWYRGWLLKNIPDDYFARFLPKKMSRPLRATVDAELARRREMPALRPPPDDHPDLIAPASNPEGFVMGVYGQHYHRPGCAFLKKPENIIPYSPFINGRDEEGNLVLIEIGPCPRCFPKGLRPCQTEGCDGIAKVDQGGVLAGWAYCPPCWEVVDLTRWPPGQPHSPK